MISIRARLQFDIFPRIYFSNCNLLKIETLVVMHAGYLYGAIEHKKLKEELKVKQMNFCYP